MIIDCMAVRTSRSSDTEFTRKTLDNEMTCVVEDLTPQGLSPHDNRLHGNLDIDITGQRTRSENVL